MSGFRYSTPYQTALDTAGVTLPGALLYFYQSGTATPLTTYSDAALSLPNTNPVVSDAGGLFPNIFLQSGVDYKVILKDADGNQLWQADPVSGGGITVAIETVANIGALRALSVSSETLGTIVYVLGYLTADDGGGGFFVCTSHNPGGDNNGTIIWSNTAGFYFTRQTNGAPNSVLWFGADRTGVADSTAAFVSTLALGYSVYVPTGLYRVLTNRLFLTSTQVMFGDGMLLSKLLSFSTTGSILTIGGVASMQVDMRVQGLAFQFDNSVARSGGQRAVRISNAARFTIFQVDMFNGLVNLSAEDCEIYSVCECQMRNGEVGVDLVPGALIPTHDLFQYCGNQITGNTTFAIRAESTGINTINMGVFADNDIEGNGTDGTGEDVCSFTNVCLQGVGPGLSFYNNWFEHNRGDRDLSMSGANVFSTFILEGNSFYSTAVTTDNVAVVTGQVSGGGNGIDATGPTNNISFASDCAGVFLGNRIGNLNNLGSVVTFVPQYTTRASANSVAVAGSGTAGAPTYSTQLTKVTTIGSLTTYNFQFVMSALGGMAGNIRIVGLAASVNDGVIAGGGLMTQFQGINLPAGAAQVTLEVAPNTAYASLVYSGDSIVSGFVTDAMLTATVTLQGYIQYNTPG